MVQEAYDVGLRYEATLDRRARDLGAHYTPPAVARGLVDLALDRRRPGTVRCVVDPTCGGGAFLVAAADALVDTGVAPADALGSLHGADVDPGAVSAARSALSIWAEHHGLDGRAAAELASVEVLDGFELLDRLADRGGADLVVGNPPFRSQLRGAAVHDGATRGALRSRFGSVAHGYTDLTGLFLVAAVRSVAPDGVVALVQPRSVLVAANAAGVRGAVVASGDLAAVWLPAEPVFEAQVQVCSPVVRGRRPAGLPGAALVAVHDRLGRQPLVEARLDAGASTWSTFVASAHGVPAVESGSGRVVGEVSTAVAGFRDEYYGLVDLVAEADGQLGDGQLRLTTVGSIEVGRHLWGVRPQRFGRRRWERPVVDASRATEDGAGLRRWWELARTPKVLVATQTRVMEAVADPDGVLAPVTPVISVVPEPSRMPGSLADAAPHALAAALCSPTASALAQHRAAGSGMSPTTVRLRAADVAELPLPVHEVAWERATAALRAAVADPGDRSGWRRYGTAAVEAYGHGPQDEVLEWWLDAVVRPARRGAEDPG